MTTVQINAAILRELSYIQGDEELMERALKSLRKIRRERKRELAQDETAYLMSSPEMAEIIRKGQEDIKDGKGTSISIEDLWK